MGKKPDKKLSLRAKYISDLRTDAKLTKDRLTGRDKPATLNADE
jgi:hypothetical protein